MTEETENTPNLEQFKEQGNEAVRNQKFAAAVLHYTQGIKLDPNNYVLYSNRSFAFLKLQQYFYALEDAYETIKLNPNWPKGYFRKAEVEFATYQFSDAFNSYQRALQLKPDDKSIMTAMTRTLQQQQKDLKADSQVPWLGAGMGLIIGVMIVVADFVYTNKPTLTHPFLMIVMTLCVAMMGYGIALIFRYYIKLQRDGLLYPPVDLAKNEDQANDQSESKRQTPRYTKSQARQRYKKGKL